MSPTLKIIMNVLGFIAMGIFFISSFVKNKKKMLGVQSIAHVFLIATESIAKTFSSIVQEVISILRNVITICGKNKKWIDIVLVVCSGTVGLLFLFLIDNKTFNYDYRFYFGLLPIIANVEYSICILSSKISERNLKISLGISNWLWGAFFLACGNYTSGIINAITGVAAFVAFFTYNIKLNKNKEISTENVNEELSE